MLVVPHLYADIEKLPSDMQVEVSHYVSFLLDKIAKTKPTSQIIQNQIEEDHSQEILALMNEIASRGTAFADIDDVMAWQKEVRQDHQLPFRD